MTENYLLVKDYMPVLEDSRVVYRQIYRPFCGTLCHYQCIFQHTQTKITYLARHYLTLKVCLVNVLGTHVHSHLR